MLIIRGVINNESYMFIINIFGGVYEKEIFRRQAV